MTIATKTLMLLLCFIVFAAGAQTTERDKKASFFFTAGAGRATLHLNYKDAPDFAQPDVRVGFGVSKPVSNHFSIYTRLNIGYRFANPDPDAEPSGGIYPYYSLAEVPRRTHWFFDLPVIVNYHFSKPNISVGAGALYNMIVKSGSDITVTDNQHDAGIVTRAAWRATRNIEVGAEYYFGITKIYEAYLNSPNHIIARNHFAQVFVNYYLVRRRGD